MHALVDDESISLCPRQKLSYAVPIAVRTGADRKNCWTNACKVACNQSTKLQRDCIMKLTTLRYFPSTASFFPSVVNLCLPLGGGWAGQIRTVCQAVQWRHGGPTSVQSHPRTEGRSTGTGRCLPHAVCRQIRPSDEENDTEAQTGLQHLLLTAWWRQLDPSEHLQKKLLEKEIDPTKNERDCRIVWMNVCFPLHRGLKMNKILFFIKQASMPHTRNHSNA